MQGITSLAVAMIVAGFAVTAASTIAAASQAPRQLFDKTVTFSFTAENVARGPSGRVVSFNTEFNFTYYISTAGRIFERATRSNARIDRSQTLQSAPDTSRNGGGARDVRFEGDKLIVLAAYKRGAGRIEVSFGPGFSSCQVAVETGKENGVFKRVGIDGVVREFLSIKFADQTCSVREGNALAS